MLKALIGVLLFFACSAPLTPLSTASTPPRSAAASEVFLAQANIINYMRRFYPEVTVDVTWRPCGERNAFYDPGKKLIILCTEMEEYPSVAILFAAHEMGHVITHQVVSNLDEADADELAAMAMITSGQAKELLESAIYFKTKWFQGHIKGDSHPSAGYRAWFFSCMGSVVDPGAPHECYMLYLSTALKWQKRLTEHI